MSLPINKTLDEIRTDLFNKISDVQQSGWLPQYLSLNRGPVRGLIELWAFGLYQLYQFLTLILAQAFPTLATDLWLDLHCAQVGLTRHSVTKAKGIVYFYRTDTSGNVLIKKNRIVKTKPDGLGKVYRFVTLADIILPDGEIEITAEVEAEEYGFASNVAPYRITDIATTIPGIAGVENRDNWLTQEGSDSETNEALQQRYTLAWLETNGATQYAYQSWARSVTGVVAVKIADQHPRGQGTVDVIIRGTAGLPTQELIDAVDTMVQEKRPINDDAIVKGPEPVYVSIIADLELVSGTPDQIINEVQARLNAMFLDPSPISNIVPLQIGEDLTKDRLIKEIMAVTGIKRITWTSPTTDIQISEDGLAVLQGMVLTYSWAEEV